MGLKDKIKQLEREIASREKILLVKRKAFISNPLSTYLKFGISWDEEKIEKLKKEHKSLV